MTDELSSPAQPPRFYSKLLREFLEFTADVLLNTLIIVGIIILVRFIFISPFEVNGSSMVPNLADKDYILVNKFIYRLAEPERGDAIALIPPHNPNTFYVKRVIGLPGEKIEFREGQVIIRNQKYPTGTALDENYLPSGLATRLPSGREQAIDIPAGHYFVMGDNRPASNDSRSWLSNPSGQTPNGALPRGQIVGKAWLDIYPWDHWGVLPEPQYSL